eukprot:EG_transcript_20872
MSTLWSPPPNYLCALSLGPHHTARASFGFRGLAWLPRCSARAVLGCQSEQLRFVVPSHAQCPSHLQCTSCHARVPAAPESATHATPCLRPLGPGSEGLQQLPVQAPQLA